MRYSPAVFLFALVAACGEDADPHTITTCMGWTDNLGNPYTGMCEAACASRPTLTNLTCDTIEQLGCGEFTFSGINGCCIEKEGTIKFFECVP
jgi:hypothetical protein